MRLSAATPTSGGAWTCLPFGPDVKLRPGSVPVTATRYTRSCGIRRPLVRVNQTRTSHRFCIVVRKRRPSLGDRIDTSMRVSDGLPASSLRDDFFICRLIETAGLAREPKTQSFNMFGIAKPATMALSRGSLDASLFRRLPCSPAHGDPRDGPPPFCSRDRRTRSPHLACHDRQRLQPVRLEREHDPVAAHHLSAERAANSEDAHQSARVAA